MNAFSVALRLLRVLLLALFAVPTFAALAHAQASEELAGTLKRVKAGGTVTIGYREASLPFSYLSARGQPIGYSIDICRRIVDTMRDTLGREITIKWKPVNPETRINAVVSGDIDLECGSTTSNLERQKTVSFSPIHFVAGTKLLVKKGSAVRSFRELTGKRVVVTTGTTNEKTMRELNEKFKLGIRLQTAPDHDASFAQITSGAADAFALDDVLLAGLIARRTALSGTAAGGGDYVVVGEFLSYDPYGIMYRKGDPQLARLVNDTFNSLSEERDIDAMYERWFLRKLPSGERLDLPMGPQLASIIRAMVAKPE